MGRRNCGSHAHGCDPGGLCSLPGFVDGNVGGNRIADIRSSKAELDSDLRPKRASVRLAPRSWTTHAIVYGLYLCFSLWAQARCLTTAIDIPLTNTDSGMGLLISPRTYKPRWRPSGIFVHTGNDDPFCYSVVRYYSWWFDRTEREAICVKEMLKMNCHLKRYLDYSDRRGFLMKDRAIKCVGMKETPRDIESEKGSWRRVWFGNYTHRRMTYHPRVVSTPTIMLRNKGLEITVNAQILERGLVYHSVSESFVGMMNLHGDRRDVPFKLLLVTDRNPVFRHKGEKIIETGLAEKCTELIAITRCTYCRGELNNQISGFWGIGGIPCRKGPTLLSELYQGHKYDENHTWERISLPTMKEELLSKCNSLIDTTCVAEWLGLMLIILCLNPAVLAITDSHKPSLTMTVLCSSTHHFP